MAIEPGTEAGHSTQNIALVQYRRDGDVHYRSLRIFQLRDEHWESERLFPIPDDVRFIDDATIVGTDLIIGYRGDSLVYLDPTTGEWLRWITVPSMYRAPIRGLVPHINVIRDISGDGRDDVVIPDFDGYYVWLQTDGGFTPRSFLAIDAALRTDTSPTSRTLTYRARTPYGVEFVRNGVTDLAFWDGNELVVFEGNGTGFEPDSTRTKLPINVENDDVTDISVEEEDQSSLRITTLHKLADFNGDSVPDVVTYAIDSRSVFGKSTTYDWYFGKVVGDATQYLTEPSTSVVSKGVQFDMLETDFDGDARKDLVIFAVEIGLGKVIGALITGSVGVDLEFYQLSDDGYPKKPNLKKDIKVEFSLSSGDFFIPTVLIEDFDGDGRRDLLVQRGKERFDVFRGEDSGTLFSKQSARFDYALPRNPDHIRAIDLDGNGRSDLVMRFDSDEGHRIQILMNTFLMNNES